MSFEKTTEAHWNGVWIDAPSRRIPSSLNIDVRNTKALLRRYVRSGGSFLEIGFAPGKMLLWVAKCLRCGVTGVDYSERGVALARALFQDMRQDADLRHESIFESTLENGTFDVVFSAGLIEHFDFPGEIVRKHVELVRPGGVAIVTVPNYGGIYGRIQRRLDSKNLSLHNLNIMSTSALLDLVPKDLTASAESFSWGRMSPWLLNINRKLPNALAGTLSATINVAAQLQPAHMSALAPTLVLVVKRA